MAALRRDHVFDLEFLRPVDDPLHQLPGDIAGPDLNTRIGRLERFRAERPAHPRLLEYPGKRFDILGEVDHLHG